MEKRYEVIEHTADFGIKVYGTTLSDLFENAAFGMFSSIADLTTIDPYQEKQVAITESSLDNLLVEWLRELLYLFTADGIILSRFTIEHISETALTAAVYGEPYTDEKHMAHTEIKAVTYHCLEVRESKDGWDAQVIFDV